VADKRKLKRNIKKLERVKTWQLLVLLVLAGFIAATFLRLNNIGMVQRRDAVKSADQSGDKEAIQYRLYDLQRYSAAHMNAASGPIYLEASYERDRNSYDKRMANDDNPHGNIFKQAQEVCAPRFDSWSLAYVHCVDNELAKFPAAQNLDEGDNPPNPQSYYHSFASPLLSFDFAGVSVLLFVGIGLAILVRFASLGVLYGLLRWRSRGL